MRLLVRIGRGTAVSLFGLAILSGCEPRDEFTDVRSDRVPAPLQETPPYTYEGQLGAIYSGDAFEVFVGNQSHLVRLAGVDCPERGESQFQAARHFIRKHSGDGRLRVEVYWRDEAQMEIGQAWSGETDLGLALIRAGLARFTDETFRDQELYRAAWDQKQADKQ